MIKVSIEGLPGEIAALIEAIQEQPEIRAARDKRFEDMTTKTSACENEPLKGVSSSELACTGINLRDLV